MPAIRLALVFPCLLTLWLSQAVGAGVPATDPALVAETTQFRETGRYDEVEQRCRDTLIRTLAEADVKSQRLRGTTLPLDWYNTADIGPTQSNGNIELQGYRYEVFDEAPVSAGRGIRYDITQPQTWNIPLFNHIRPLPQAMQTLPEGGYLVPAGWAAIVRPYLSQHGVRHRVIARALKEMRVESMRVQDDDVAFEPRPFQGRTRTQVNGRWATDTVTLPPGSLFIPMDQPNAWLAAQLL